MHTLLGLVDIQAPNLLKLTGYVMHQQV